MLINEEKISTKNAYFCNANTWEANRIVDLRYLIAEFGVRFSKIFDQKGLYLAIRVAPDLPRFFRARANQLKYLMDSIIAYNLKYIGNGGVIVDVKSAFAGGKQHEITMGITVSGLEISDQRVKTIFDQSYGGSDDDADEFPDNLHTARRVTRILGGDIFVQRIMWLGTRYVVQVNLEAVSEKGHWN